MYTGRPCSPPCDVIAILLVLQVPKPTDDSKRPDYQRNGGQPAHVCLLFAHHHRQHLPRHAMEQRVHVW